MALPYLSASKPVGHVLNYWSTFPKSTLPFDILVPLHVVFLLPEWTPFLSPALVYFSSPLRYKSDSWVCTPYPQMWNPWIRRVNYTVPFKQGIWASLNFGIHGDPGMLFGVQEPITYLHCLCSDELQQSVSIQARIIALFSLYGALAFLEKELTSLPYNHLSLW